MHLRSTSCGALVFVLMSSGALPTTARPSTAAREDSSSKLLGLVETDVGYESHSVHIPDTVTADLTAGLPGHPSGLRSWASLPSQYSEDGATKHVENRATVAQAVDRGTPEAAVATKLTAERDSTYPQSKNEKIATTTWNKAPEPASMETSVEVENPPSSVTNAVTSTVDASKMSTELSEAQEFSRPQEYATTVASVMMASRDAAMETSVESKDFASKATNSDKETIEVNEVTSTPAKFKEVSRPQEVVNIVASVTTPQRRAVMETSAENKKSFSSVSNAVMTTVESNKINIEQSNVEEVPRHQEFVNLIALAIPPSRPAAIETLVEGENSLSSVTNMVTTTVEANDVANDVANETKKIKEFLRPQEVINVVASITTHPRFAATETSLEGENSLSRDTHEHTTIDEMNRVAIEPSQVGDVSRPQEITNVIPPPRPTMIGKSVEGEYTPSSFTNAVTTTADANKVSIKLSEVEEFSRPQECATTVTSVMRASRHAAMETSVEGENSTSNVIDSDMETLEANKVPSELAKFREVSRRQEVVNIVASIITSQRPAVMETLAENENFPSNVTNAVVAANKVNMKLSNVDVVSRPQELATAVTSVITASRPAAMKTSVVDENSISKVINVDTTVKANKLPSGPSIVEEASRPQEVANAVASVITSPAVIGKSVERENLYSKFTNAVTTTVEANEIPTELPKVEDISRVQKRNHAVASAITPPRPAAMVAGGGKPILGVPSQLAVFADPKRFPPLGLRPFPTGIPGDLGHIWLNNSGGIPQLRFSFPAQKVDLSKVAEGYKTFKPLSINNKEVDRIDLKKSLSFSALSDKLRQVVSGLQQIGLHNHFRNNVNRTIPKASTAAIISPASVKS